MALTTTELLAAIRLRAKLPSSSLSFANPSVLQLATDTLWAEVVPMLLAEQQEFFVTRTDVPLLAGVSDYPIPGRAVGSKLRNVQLVDNATGATEPLTHVSPERAVGWESSQGRPVAFLVEGGGLRLFPRPQGTENASLRLTYYGRPGSLVLPTACTVALSRYDDLVTGYPVPYTTIQAPTAATAAYGNGNVFGMGELRLDIIRPRPPFSTVAADVRAFTSGGYTFLVPQALGPLIQPGDWLCVAGTAPMPQVQLELHPMLCAKVAATMLASVGDLEGAQLQAGVAGGLEQRAGPLNTPRVDGAVIKQRGGIRGR